MKRRIASIALCAVMAVGLAACGGSKDTASKQDSSASSASTSTATSTSTSTSEEAETQETESLGKKTIGYYKDAADDYYKAGYEVFQALVESNEETKDWEIIDKVGGGTSSDQLQAIEDFITAGVDAIICVQNSPEITAECLTKANDAKIPYFAFTHAPAVPAGGELAGFVGYDFVACGVLGGKDAIDYGVKKLVMVEGKLGQGTAGAQSVGFLKAYQDAGLDIGGDYNDVATNKTSGGKDLEIVLWASGDWQADPAKQVVADAITSLGADGFDGLYVQNDEMMDGAIQAIEEAGLNPADYWLGSSNGKEKSWKWVADGKETMDVNQTPTLEAELCYQQVVSYMKGESYRKYVNPSVIAFNKSNVDSLTLIPYDAAKYMEMRANGEIKADLSDEATFTDATSIITFN